MNLHRKSSILAVLIIVVIFLVSCASSAGIAVTNGEWDVSAVDLHSAINAKIGENNIYPQIPEMEMYEEAMLNVYFYNFTPSAYILMVENSTTRKVITVTFAMEINAENSMADGNNPSIGEMVGNYYGVLLKTIDPSEFERLSALTPDDLSVPNQKIASGTHGLYVLRVENGIFSIDAYPNK